MAKRRGGRLLLTDDEFLIRVDMEGGLRRATFEGGLSAKDLQFKDTELYKAMRAWDTWRAREASLEKRVIDALLGKDSAHDQPN